MIYLTVHKIVTFETTPNSWTLEYQKTNLPYIQVFTSCLMENSSVPLLQRPNLGCCRGKNNRLTKNYKKSINIKCGKKTQSFTVNTLRTGAFKLFKFTFPGSKQFKSTFIMCFFKYL